MAVNSRKVCFSSHGHIKIISDSFVLDRNDHFSNICHVYELDQNLNSFVLQEDVRWGGFERLSLGSPNMYCFCHCLHDYLRDDTIPYMSANKFLLESSEYQVGFNT
jgi:hypothetical protein